MTNGNSIGDIRAAFNAGYCYGTEEDASPEDLNCAWDIYQKRSDAVPDDWQPINTAPQPDLYDDSVCRYLLGIVPDKLDEEPLDWRSLVTVIWWEPNIKGGCWCSEGAEGVEPTYWKPISFGEKP